MSSSRVVLLSIVMACFAAGGSASAATPLLGMRTAVDPEATTLFLRFRDTVQFTPAWIDARTYALDLPGVSSNLRTQSQAVQSPLVNSYRVVNFEGADNQPHLRVEVALKSEAKIDAEQSGGELALKIQAPASAPSAPASGVPLNPKRGTAIHAVQVAELEGTNALEVQIMGNGNLEYRTMQLTHPERIVIDLPNTVNQIHQKQLDVNTAPLRSVRIGQLSRTPLVSRVVLDLDSKTSMQVRKEDGNVVISLNRPGDSAAAPASEPSAEKMAEGAEPLPATPAVSEAKKEQAPPAVHLAALHVTPAAPAPRPVATSAPVAAPPAPVAPAAAVSSPSALPAAAAQPARLPVSEDRIANTKAMEVIAAQKPADSGASDKDAAPADDPLAKILASPTPEEQSAEPSKLLAQAAPPASPASPQTPAPVQQRPTYTGEPISVNLRDVDLKDFFRLIHEISGLNIVLDPTVSGNVTIVVDEVPWDQAMEIVMRNNGLGKEVEGNVVRIAKLSTLEAEEKQRRDLTIAVEQAQPTITTTRTLNYAKAADLIPTIKKFLTQRGNVIADARTNTLIIMDLPGKIPQIDQLIHSLDTKSLQVEIEARVVSASRSFARDIGTQLAASGLTGNVALGGTGLVGTSPINRGTTPPLFIGTPTTGGGFANLPQPLLTNLAAQGPTSGFTFLLTGGNTFALDSIITAAESRGVGKLLSRPKIITQNNVEATVKQGVRIPIQTTVNNTISVQYVDVVLRLTVTPQITAEGTIFLKTDIENTSIDPGIATTPGQFGLDTQAATTQVLVTNGGTVFFGGVVQTINRVNEQQVPLLGSMPLIGNLFKRKQTTSTTNELLFFITPRIVQS